MRPRLQALGLAAIDINDGALHPSRFFSAEKRNDLGNIVRFPRVTFKFRGGAAYVFVHVETLLPRPLLEQLLPSLSPDGLNEVHVYAVLNSLFGDRF